MPELNFGEAIKDFSGPRTEDALARERARSNLSVLSDSNPDEAAYRRRLGDEAGLPSEVVKGNEGRIEAELRSRSAEQSFSSALRTAAFFNDPRNAEIASDDVEALTQVEHTWLGDVGRSAGARVLNLGGGLLRGIGTATAPVAEFLEERIPLTEMLLGERAANFPSVGQAAERLEGITFGGQTRTTWEDVKSAPLSEFLPFAIEQGIVSTPDMVAAVAALPAYLAARTGEIGQSRAENDLRDNATVDDLVKAAPAAVASALLERFGARGIIGLDDALKQTGAKAIAGATARGAAKEGATEFTQEVIESIAETTRTVEGFDLAQTLDRGLAGAVAGVGVGATVRGVTATAESAVKARRAAQESQRRQDTADAVRNTKLATRAPKAAVQHIAQVMGDEGSVSIDANALTEEQANELGLDQDTVAEAIALGGDVELTTRQHARLVLDPGYEELNRHIRTSADEMTLSEAQEFAETGIQDEIARLIEEPAEVAEIDPEIATAQVELGTRALFQTAEQAGMTKKGFEVYRIALERSAKKARKLKARAVDADLARSRTIAWQKEAQQIRTEVEPEIAALPIYRVVRDIAGEKMNREATIAALENNSDAADAIATLYDFGSGDALLAQLRAAEDFETAVITAVEQNQNAKHGITSRSQKAKRAVQNDQLANVLATEVNTLRTSQPKVKTAFVREFAKSRIEATKVGNVRPGSFEAAGRRKAGQAAKLLRGGDRDGAAQAKFQQLANHEMARQSYEARDTVAKQTKYLRSFSMPSKMKRLRTAMGDEKLRQVQTLLAEYELGPRLSDRKRAQLNVQALAAGEALVPPTRKSHRDLTVTEFRDLHDTVKAIDNSGRTSNRLRREGEKRELDQVANDVALSVRRNLKKKDVPISETKWQSVKRKVGREGLMYLVQPDTILRAADGFRDLGTVYGAIKAPLDRAISDVWLPRKAEEAKRQKELFESVDRKGWNKPTLVPGTTRSLSKKARLAVALNYGNAEGRSALRNDFTQEEIDAILDTLTRKDWEFVQASWVYVDSFWPEVRAKQRQRVGFAPQKVEGLPFNTKHGEMKGGYFPLSYDSSRGSLAKEDSVEELAQAMRGGSGRYASKQTRRGHTKERAKNGGRKVRLDPNVITSHVDEVVYDLAVGDALFDAHRILNHKSVREAFETRGQLGAYEQLDLWLNDVAVGEQGPTGAWGRLAMVLRQNFTVARLAFNVKTVVLQPLGVFQTMAQIGTGPTLRSIGKFTVSPRGSYQAALQSKFMQGRDDVFSRDIQDARRLLNEGWVSNVPILKQTAKVIDGSGFWALRKVQQVVDVVTWNAAFQQGLGIAKGDHDKAMAHADQVVRRTQASGLFADRSALERGTFGKNKQQQEFVKLFTTFASYFVAKNNVALERFGRTKFRSPADLMDFISSMFLLYVTEALVIGAAGVIFHGDDEEEALTNVAETIFGTATAGIPLVREAAGAIQGFPGGGPVGAVASDVGQFTKQVQQGEADPALFRSVVRLLADFGAPLPASQLSKVSRALEEDGEFVDYLFGHAK